MKTCRHLPHVSAEKKQLATSKYLIEICVSLDSIGFHQVAEDVYLSPDRGAGKDL